MDWTGSQDALRDKLDFIATGGKLSERIQAKYGTRNAAASTELSVFDQVAQAQKRESALLDKLKEKAGWRRNSNAANSESFKGTVAALGVQAKSLRRGSTNL